MVHTYIQPKLKIQVSHKYTSILPYTINHLVCITCIMCTNSFHLSVAMHSDTSTCNYRPVPWYLKHTIHLLRQAFIVTHCTQWTLSLQRVQTLYSRAYSSLNNESNIYFILFLCINSTSWQHGLDSAVMQFSYSYSMIIYS